MDSTFQVFAIRKSLTIEPDLCQADQERLSSSITNFSDIFSSCLASSYSYDYNVCFSFDDMFCISFYI